jgi:protein phosphatase
MRRAELVSRARHHGRPAIAIVLDVPLELCLARNAARPRTVRALIIRRQHDELRRSLDRLDLEGFSAVHVLNTEAEIEQIAVQIEKGPVARALSW